MRREPGARDEGRVFTLMSEEGMRGEDRHEEGSVKGFKEVSLFRCKEVNRFKE